jgi:hypothetical protein
MPAEQKELRQLSPADLLDFLDVAALARNMERTKLINKILLQWAEVEAHRSNVLQRAARGNPLLSESTVPATDWGDMR